MGSRYLASGTIELNEAQNSVVVHRPAFKGNSGNQYPGDSFGPLPAKFGTDKITFTWRTDSAVSDYVINRVTGAVSGKFTLLTNQDTSYFTWTCQVGKRQF
jgi:hypothetical protein